MEINIKIDKDGYVINIDGKEFKNRRLTSSSIEQEYSDEELCEYLNDNDLFDELLNSFTFFIISNIINRRFLDD